MTPQAQIHSWSFSVLICAKPRQALSHCWTDNTEQMLEHCEDFFF